MNYATLVIIFGNGVFLTYKGNQYIKTKKLQNELQNVDNLDAFMRSAYGKFISSGINSYEWLDREVISYFRPPSSMHSRIIYKIFDSIIAYEDRPTADSVVQELIEESNQLQMEAVQATVVLLPSAYFIEEVSSFSNSYQFGAFIKGVPMELALLFSDYSQFRALIGGSAAEHALLVNLADGCVRYDKALEDKVLFYHFKNQALKAGLPEELLSQFSYYNQVQAFMAGAPKELALKFLHYIQVCALKEGVAPELALQFSHYNQLKELKAGMSAELALQACCHTIQLSVEPKMVRPYGYEMDKSLIQHIHIRALKANIPIELALQFSLFEQLILGYSNGLEPELGLLFSHISQVIVYRWLYKGVKAELALQFSSDDQASALIENTPQEELASLTQEQLNAFMAGKPYQGSGSSTTIGSACVSYGPGDSDIVGQITNQEFITVVSQDS